MDDEIKSEKEVFAELAKVKTNPSSLKMDHRTSENIANITDDNFIEEAGGQLTIDVFQDEENIYIQSAVAGVSPDDLEINIAKESVSIRGTRERVHSINEKDFFYQECFWGKFSRSIVLPEEIDSEKSSATFKNGILTIKMPKISKRKTKGVKIKVG